MGIRKPGVKRKQWNLDPETDQQSSHQHKLSGHPHFPGKNGPQAEINAACHEGQAQEGSQDQHARYGCDDQKFRCGIRTIRSTPDRNQHPERNELKLIEQEEQQQVLRQERTVHGSTDHQQQSEVDPRTILNLAGSDGGYQTEHAIHQHQGQRQTIHRKGIVQPDDMHPTGLFHQLQCGIGRIEGQQQSKAGHGLHHQHHDRDLAQALTGGGSWPEHQPEGTQQWNQKKKGEQHLG